jgi:hypothetical protein
LEAWKNDSFEVETPRCSIRTSSGAIRLAMAAGARLRSATMIETEPFHFCIEIGPQIDLQPKERSGHLSRVAEKLWNDLLPDPTALPIFWSAFFIDSIVIPEVDNLS